MRLIKSLRRLSIDVSISSLWSERRRGPVSHISAYCVPFYDRPSAICVDSANSPQLATLPDLRLLIAYHNAYLAYSVPYLSMGEQRREPMFLVQYFFNHLGLKLKWLMGVRWRLIVPSFLIIDWLLLKHLLQPVLILHKHNIGYLLVTYLYTIHTYIIHDYRTYNGHRRFLPPP